MKSNYDLHVPFSTSVNNNFKIKVKIKSINKMKNEIVISEAVHGIKNDVVIGAEDDLV